MRVEVFSRHSTASSHGQGAAPETARRKLEKSLSANTGVLSNRRKIVATAGKTVTRFFLIAARTASGVKRSRITAVAPVRSGASKPPFNPSECANGTATSTTSSEVSPITGSDQDWLANV